MTERITAWDLGKVFTHADADHLAPPPTVVEDDDPDDPEATDAITEGITDDGDGDEDALDRTNTPRGAPARNTDDAADDVDGLSSK